MEQKELVSQFDTIVLNLLLKDNQKLNLLPFFSNNLTKDHDKFCRDIKDSYLVCLKKLKQNDLELTIPKLTQVLGGNTKNIKKLISDLGILPINSKTGKYKLNDILGKSHKFYALFSKDNKGFVYYKKSLRFIDSNLFNRYYEKIRFY